MRRTERLQGLRLMKCEEVYDRRCRAVLSPEEAAEVLGVSRRTVGNLLERFVEQGKKVAADDKKVTTEALVVCLIFLFTGLHA